MVWRVKVDLQKRIQDSGGGPRRTRRTRRTRKKRRTRTRRTKRTRMFGHLALNSLSLAAQWIGIEGGKGVSNQSYLKKVWILSMMQKPKFTPVFSLVS